MIRCRLFGHRVVYSPDHPTPIYCSRCGKRYA